MREEDERYMRRLSRNTLLWSSSLSKTNLKRLLTTLDTELDKIIPSGRKQHLGRRKRTYAAFTPSR